MQGLFLVPTLLILLLTIVEFSVSESDQPLGSCESGKYRGQILVSRNGLKYEAYKGIKYGIVPDRFEISKFAPISYEEKNAIAFGDNCVQPLFGQTQLLGNEDCLYLNVYTPKTDDKKRAVLVFIHGGGFTYHAADLFGANYLIDEDVVLVTINYRLGIHGFLSTNDNIARGNFGLYDQNLALKWVQRNIEAFGGDKNRVSIIGESAGASSVLYHVLSPLSKGLFRAAIPLSGSPLNPFGFQESNLQLGVQVGLKLNCDVSSSASLVACLRTKSNEQLLKAQLSFAKWHIDPLFPFLPTLEKKNSRNPNPLLPDYPEDLMKAGEFHKVPILMTMCKDEGLLFHSAAIVRNEKLMNEMNTEWGRIAPITFMYENDPILKAHTKEVSIKLRKFYFNNEPVSALNAHNLTNAYTDTWFFRGIRETALRMGKHTDVYLGVIDYVSPEFSVTRMFGISEILGSAHADDLKFIFSNNKPEDPIPLIPVELKSESDIQFSKALVKQIANFIKNGNTEITFGSSTNKATWNPISEKELTSRKLNWLTLNNENPKVEINFGGQRGEFWDEIVKPDHSFKEEL